jgi:predicted alpha/beta superfamily hydrolase
MDGKSTMGKVEEFKLSIKPFSQSPRNVWVYLPDSYQTSKKKYDVLYMFDGHNIFFDNYATYGKSWGMKKYLDETNIDLVVVGVDCNHVGNRRLSEYCPYKPVITELESLPKIEPLGKKTAQWFVKTLKPRIEKKYRVHSDRKHIGIGGSSMGGLMSEYMIAKYNDVFSKAACVSPSTHFCYDDLMELIHNTKFHHDTKLYIDQGSQEVHGKRLFIDAMEMMLHINHTYNQQGCSTYPHLTPGGRHCEKDWERVVPVFLEYLYPNLYEKML